MCSLIIAGDKMIKARITDVLGYTSERTVDTFTEALEWVEWTLDYVTDSYDIDEFWCEGYASFVVNFKVVTIARV
jgi:hypothetical protein